MNALLHASVGDLWSLAGWTMVHFLWLGAIVAALATVARIALRSASPSIRYAVAISSLFVLAALPFATAAWLVNYSPPLKGGAGGGIARSITRSTAEPPPTPDPTNELIELHAAETPTAPGSAEGGLTNAVQPPAANALPIANPRQSQGLPAVATVLPPRGSPSTLDARLSTLVFYLPWLWLIGTPLTFALLVSGVVGTRRLGRSSHTIDSDPIVELLAHLAASLRITRRVTVAVCDRVASPVLIGIIRPMILLPPAAITGWSPDELEMVLLHELSHVRRWDNFVNLLQRCVESLLFFHPAVWLISSWARREREACCDATVVARTNRPHAYAELLVALAAQLPRSVLFHPAASSAMSAGPLRSRIRQILKLEDDPMLVSGKSLTIAFASLLVAATLAVLYLPKIGQADQSATEVTENAEKSTIPGNTQGSPKLLNTPMVVSAPNSAEVSEQAWKQLGIRIHLASPAEQTSRFGHALEVDSGIAIPKNMEGPVFLLGINQVETNNFDDLAAALQKAKGEHGTVVKCVVHSKEGRIWIDTKLDGSDKPEQVISKVPILAPPLATSKFPSLENQKLADLAYKRLGLELVPIGEDDLKRVKALGYEGGVQVIGLTGASQVRYGDILVGLHVWPTKDLNDVVAVIERKDLAELNPLKFYVVRTDEQAPNGMVASGRLPVQLLPAPSVGFTDPGLDSNPQINLVEVPLNNPYRQGAPGTYSGPFPDVFPQAPPASTAGPYTAPAIAPIPAIATPANAVPVQVQVIETSNSDSSETPKLVSKPLALAVRDNEHFLVFFYPPDPESHNLKTFQRHLQELKQQFAAGAVGAAVVNVKADPAVAQLYNIEQVPSYVVFRNGQHVATYTGVQSTDQLLAGLRLAGPPVVAYSSPGVPTYQSHARSQLMPAANIPTATLQPTTYTVVPTPLTASQNMMPSATLIFDAAAQRLDIALQHKNEAMEKRLAAKSDEEVEKAKRDLDSANKQLEEAKQQFEDAKRQREKLDTENQFKNVIRSGQIPQSKYPSLPATFPAVPTSPVTSTTSAQQAPIDDTSTPEQILTAPSSPSPTVSLPEKADASRLVAPQPQPYDIAAEQTTPKDTPTADAHSNPSIGAHHDDNSSDSRSSRSSRTDTNRSRTSPQSAANASEAQSNDRILVAYNIPAELTDNVNRMRDLSGAHGEFESDGRYVLQATAESQKRFRLLLDTTPKWRDPEAAKSRVAKVYARTEKDGQEYLDWQPTGLTFTNISNPKFPHSNVGGGGWAVPSGAVVAEVVPGSPADWNGIEPGDIMTKVGDFETRNLAELESLLKTQGQAYSTKTVHCMIYRITAKFNASIPAQLNLATDSAQSKQSGLISETTAGKAQATPPHKGSPSLPAATAGKSTLRYDGKTFDEWRSIWRNELSVEKRAEAVKALAAFGRAGFGKEASETILDVAGEYDFSFIDGESVEGKFKQTVLAELAPEYRTQTFAPSWVPDLVARVHKDSKKWMPLAQMLFDKLKTTDAGIITMLRSLAASENEILRTTALSALVKNSASSSTDQQLDENTRKLIDNALQSKDPNVIVDALNMLIYAQPGGGGGFGSAGPPPKLLYQPAALESLLFHVDEDVRRGAHYKVKFVDDKLAAELAAKLLTILKDNSRQRDHIEAVRALAAIGPRAKIALPELTNILNHDDDPALAAAAIVAANHVAGQLATKEEVAAIEAKLLPALQEKYGDKEFTSRVKQEEAILP